MSDKSHVSMEQHQCVVCHQLFDTGSILLDKHVRATLEPRTVTGRSLCPEHQKMKDEGYVALVAVNEATREPTGWYAHLREAVWGDVFTAPLPPQGVCHIPQSLFEKLQQARAEGN